MSGTFTSKWLAEGQLPAADADLYVVPAATTDIIKTIVVVNTTAGAVTMNLRVKKSGGSTRRIWEKDYSVPLGEQRVLDLNIALETGDSLRGDASAATSIDYTVFGIRET